MARHSTRRTQGARRHGRLRRVQARLSRRRPRHDGVFLEYPPEQTPREELANWVTHAVAAVASVAGGSWLIAAAVRQSDWLTMMGCAVYAASLMAVFTMSSLSHGARTPRLRGMFRALDQASIYLLIAGTATPFLIRYLLPYGWDWMLPLLWGLALLWAWDKVRGHRVNSMSVVSYLSLAWLPVLAARPIFAVMPARCTLLVLAMGACYMLGVVFLVYDDRGRYFHALWHLFVIAASACSFAAIAMYLV